MNVSPFSLKVGHEPPVHDLPFEMVTCTTASCPLHDSGRGGTKRVGLFGLYPTLHPCVSAGDACPATLQTTYHRRGAHPGECRAPKYTQVVDTGWPGDHHHFQKQGMKGRSQKSVRGHSWDKCGAGGGSYRPKGLACGHSPASISSEICLQVRRPAPAVQYPEGQLHSS